MQKRFSISGDSILSKIRVYSILFDKKVIKKQQAKYLLLSFAF